MQQQASSPLGNLGAVKFHTDPILHSKAADIRGDESNVIYLTLLDAGIKLAQKGPTILIRPKILKIKYLCKALMESMAIAASKGEAVLNPNTFHYSYLYPAMVDSPDSSIPTAHNCVTVYDNCALQPTTPLNFITDEETFFRALVEHYIMAVVHFESDYKTIRRIIQKERWGEIAVLIPSSDARKGIPTSELGIISPLANDWTAPNS
jgi:hypothetical protein